MKTHFINGSWCARDGAEFESRDPATGATIWRGTEAGVTEVDDAVRAARSASKDWSKLELPARIKFLEQFAKALEEQKREVAELISEEMGKPLWESLGEVGAMVNKIPISIEAYAERRAVSQGPLGDATVLTRFRSLGVLAVFGPFNSPGHLPNGQIVPALLAGNAVVFKPSEFTPAVGQKLVELWEAAGLPAGVLNLVQGGRESGVALARHPSLDGLLFTGSARTGNAIHQSFAGQAHKLLVLEMGGNNPLVVWDAADHQAAAYLTVQSAYITAGQRCVSARRLIVQEGAPGASVLESIMALIGKITVGPYTADPEPFMGPLISPMAGRAMLDAEKKLLSAGGASLVPLKRLGGNDAMIAPGLIDVTAIHEREDRECFGPLLQVIRVKTFDRAIEEANNTVYGLSAGLLSDDRARYDQFYEQVRAQNLNWNRPTTGASSRAPFGGIGESGNHRPAGYYVADYCSDPVVSIEMDKLSLPEQRTPGLTF